MKILAVLLLCCVAAVCHAQSTTTQIDPNSQIGGPLQSTNTMLPGVASDGTNGLVITGALKVASITRSTAPVCFNGPNGELTTVGCSGGGGGGSASVLVNGSVVSASVSSGSTVVTITGRTLSTNLGAVVTVNRSPV